jgi:hypothetical protein
MCNADPFHVGAVYTGRSKQHLLENSSLYVVTKVITSNNRGEFFCQVQARVHNNEQLLLQDYRDGS